MSPQTNNSNTAHNSKYVIMSLASIIADLTSTKERIAYALTADEQLLFREMYGNTALKFGMAVGLDSRGNLKRL